MSRQPRALRQEMVSSCPEREGIHRNTRKLLVFSKRRRENILVVTLILRFNREREKDSSFHCCLSGPIDNLDWCWRGMQYFVASKCICICISPEGEEAEPIFWNCLCFGDWQEIGEHPEYPHLFWERTEGKRNIPPQTFYLSRGLKFCGCSVTRKEDSQRRSIYIYPDKDRAQPCLVIDGILEWYNKAEEHCKCWPSSSKSSREREKHAEVVKWF